MTASLPKNPLSVLLPHAHAPPAGVGSSLGAALCGLEEGPWETLALEAAGLSLLEPVEEEDSPEARWRVHPLLGEFLRQQPQPDSGGFAGMTGWFVSRLVDRPAEEAEQQGRAWDELHAEHAGLVDWLARVPIEQVAAVAQTGGWCAMLCGPYGAWAELCERGLRHLEEAPVRSMLLWTQSYVLLRAGQLDRALEQVQEKARLDRQRGDERGGASGGTDRRPLWPGASWTRRCASVARNCRSTRSGARDAICW